MCPKASNNEAKQLLRGSAKISRQQQKQSVKSLSFNE